MPEQPEPSFTPADLHWTQNELRRRFSGIGCCMARAAEFARLFPAVPPDCVEEALHRLSEEGAVERECLADGSFAFFFPLR